MGVQLHRCVIGPGGRGAGSEGSEGMGVAEGHNFVVPIVLQGRHVLCMERKGYNESVKERERETERQSVRLRRRTIALLSR